MELYTRLFRYLKPYRMRLLWAAVFMGFTSGLLSLQAYIVQPVLDRVFLNKDITLLYVLPIALVIVVVLKGAASYARDYLMGWIGQRIVNDIRDQLYAHLTSLSFSYYAQMPTGVLISRIINDVNLVQGALTRAPSNLIQGILTMIALTGYVIYKNWRLALFSVIVLPFLGIALSKFSKRFRQASTQMQEQYGGLTNHLYETISGMRIVKAFGMESYESRRFASRNRGLFNSLMRSIKTNAISHPIMEIITTTSVATVILFGGYWIIQGRMTVGEFFSFLTALYFLYRPIKELNGVNSMVQDGVAAARRIFEVLDTKSEIIDLPGAASAKSDFRTIEFSNVAFQYENEPVLKGISLTVNAGETIAIVGRSGGGKTTLVNLVPRFYDVSAGAIKIDGRDIREVSLRSLRSLTSIVTQQTFLFNETVKENIAYGDPTKHLDEVVHAASMAYADDFIRALPQGYDTVIGEAGIKLSGGQRQRLAIARALLKNAPILILDEATSSLDSESEREVQKALDSLISGRTSFIIAHRLSTIMNADRIIVLKEGRIVEQGRHGELLARGGEYKSLYDQQFRDEQSAKVRHQ